MNAADVDALAAEIEALKEVGPHLLAETFCSHEWIVTRQECRCRKCSGLMIGGAAYVPVEKVGDVFASVLDRLSSHSQRRRGR